MSRGKRVIAGVYSQTPQGGCVWCHSSWKLPSATQTKHAVPDLCGYISRAGNVRSSSHCVWSKLLWFGEWPWEDTLISSWRCNVSFISFQVQWTLVWTGAYGGTFPTDYMKGREGRGRGGCWRYSQLEEHTGRHAFKSDMLFLQCYEVYCCSLLVAVNLDVHPFRQFNVLHFVPFCILTQSQCFLCLFYLSYSQPHQ